VEAYAAVPPDDPFAASKAMFAALAGELAGPGTRRDHPGRLETGHGRLLATLFGTVTVTRCAWRKPGAPDYLPAGAALSLPAGRHSRTLAELACPEAARGSYESAHDAITRRCGNVMGKRQAGDAAVNAAAAGQAGFAAVQALPMRLRDQARNRNQRLSDLARAVDAVPGRYRQETAKVYGCGKITRADCWV